MLLHPTNFCLNSKIFCRMHHQWLQLCILSIKSNLQVQLDSRKMYKLFHFMMWYTTDVNWSRMSTMLQFKMHLQSKLTFQNSKIQMWAFLVTKKPYFLQRWSSNYHVHIRLHRSSQRSDTDSQKYVIHINCHCQNSKLEHHSLRCLFGFLALSSCVGIIVWMHNVDLWRSTRLFYSKHPDR